MPTRDINFFSIILTSSWQSIPSIINLCVSMCSFTIMSIPQVIPFKSPLAKGDLGGCVFSGVILQPPLSPPLAAATPCRLGYMEHYPLLAGCRGNCPPLAGVQGVDLTSPSLPPPFLSFP